MRTLVWLFAPAMLLAQVNVPYERIRDADKEPGNWLTYSRDYSGQRYSPLDQINTGNVGKLHIAWMRQVNELDTLRNLADRGGWHDVHHRAAQRGGGARRRYRPHVVELPQGYSERPAAVLRQSESRPGDSRQHGLLRQHRCAPDRARRAHRARVRWDVTMADYKTGYSSTGAPLAVKDKIITGMAGGEYGVRGFIDAYDAKTGKRALALQHHSRQGRTRQRDLGRR